MTSILKPDEIAALLDLFKSHNSQQDNLEDDINNELPSVAEDPSDDSVTE